MTKLIWINRLMVALIIVFFYSCDNLEKKKEAELREQSLNDSINKLKKKEKKREKQRKDSIINIEQEIAIADIKFNISKERFNEKKKILLDKIKLSNMEYYRGMTFFYYKLGDYGFRDLNGFFYGGLLYKVQLNGAIVQYDEYDRFMPDQYNALKKILINKHGKPRFENEFPKWTDMEKGDEKRVDIWHIGNKRIDIQITCNGIDYSLDLIVVKPEIVRFIEERKKKDEEASAKNASKIL